MPKIDGMTRKPEWMEWIETVVKESRTPAPVLIHSKRDVAQALGITERQLRQLVSETKMPAFEEVAGVKGYTPETLAELRAQARLRATAKK